MLTLVKRISIKSAISILALTIVGSQLTSCTYFKRKDCEAINWHQYAYNLALKGTRPANDEYLNQCRKMEAEMSEQYSQSSRTEDPYLNERTNLRNQFSTNDSRISNLRREIKQLQDENSKNKIEMQGC